MVWGEMERLLFFLMEVPFSQQSSAGLHWQGICFLALSAPLESGQRKAATLGSWKNFLRADQGMEMLLGSS